MPPSDRISRRIDEAKPGLYRVRRTRNGPWIAAEITVTAGLIEVIENGVPHAERWPVDNFPTILSDAVMAGEAFGHPLLRILWFGVPIERQEHRALLALSRWAQANDPRHPAANPDRPVNMNDVPIDRLF